MGLFQMAAATYNNFEHLAGVEVAGMKETLAPIAHKIANATVEITIDGDGNFVNAEPCKRKIPIPVTESSSGRTKGKTAHALCDTLGYISGIDSSKRDLYVTQLAAWVRSEYSSPKVEAVYKYVINMTVLEDIKNKIPKLFNNKGDLKDEKELVCWTVIGLGDESGSVWKDRELQKKYADYYISNKKSDEKDFCMISGEIEQKAEQHLKGVVSQNGNAKLISSNDDEYFTFRGRFANDSEALSIGFISSQKAHNALKWVVANEGAAFGGRMFVCWNPKGKKVPKPTSSFLKNEQKPAEPTHYKMALDEALMGYREQLPDNEDVVLASFDAANSGRLAVSYYNELKASDYLERLHYWEETCCWIDNFGISSPTLFQIANCAFGVYRKTQKGERFETDDRIIKQQMQRLISCRVDKAAMPYDLMQGVVHNAENLQLYDNKNMQIILFTACAIINKYKHDRFKEEYQMSLEPERADRSYQYGRLLAILEKAEADTYEESEKRDTNAIRMQSVYVRRPAYAFKIIMEQLKAAYYPKLKPWQKDRYEKLIGEIMEQISRFPTNEYNKSLDETYLLGYYLQKKALYAKKQSTENTDKNMEDKNND